METKKFKNSKGKTLVGDFYYSNHEEDSKKCVILCHGFTGDRHEWGWFDDTCSELSSNGINCFTIDFSGSGESEDDSISLENQVDDLKCAISYVKELGMKSIGLYGHSLGGLTCLEAYKFEDELFKCVNSMVLTAPVTNKYEGYREKLLNKSNVSEGEEGYIKIRAEEKKSFRKRFVIDKKLVYERENINQEALLKDIDVPVLIIHGRKDESVPVEDSRSAIRLLNDYSQLQIFDFGKHNFDNCRDLVLKFTKDWFSEKL